MSIPEAALHAAAKAHMRNDIGNPDADWPTDEELLSGRTGKDYKAEYVREVMPIIEAAAPVIHAEVLRQEASRLAQWANHNPVAYLWKFVDEYRNRANNLVEQAK